MPLSPETVKSLTTDLARLRQQRQRLDQEIVAIEQLLPATETPRSAVVATPDVDLTKLGLRDAVRAVFRDAARPLTSREVGDRLEAAGVQPAGSQPLRDRVYGEIHKLLTVNKELVRLDDGRYELAAEGTL